MDAAGASCSSVDAVARELLMATLEELSQEQLKRFRHKLRDAPLDGRSIPWGRLERSDAVDLVDKLIEFYEPVPAVEMTRQVLKRSDIRDVASRLKQQQLQKLGPTSVLLSVSAFKKKYREHVLRQHAKVKERNARSVKINKRFTKLLIAPGTGAVEDELLGPLGEPEPERARRSDTHTFNRLFRGNDEESSQPLTVVLQGPAGIGKTMAAKKILYDWAAGKLYHSQVDFAFFMPCGELLERPGKRSLADLVLDQCPDRAWPVKRILAQPNRLLFILDGADELPTLPSSEATPCKDPLEATSGLRVLSGLLSQELLPGARLLVTTRHAATGRLQGRLCSPQCAEIRGFSDKDKKKYFFKFFRDERKAERAYRFVKENETLFALCFVPFVCWIVCTVLQQQLELGRDLSRTSKTTTSVYLLFITSMLKSAGTNGPRVQGELRTLCRLAREGILDHHKAQFSEEDLEKLKLRGSQVQTIFLNKKEIPGVLKTEVTYQFIDQSFQEFLAALSYLLEAERTPGTPAGGVQKLLNSDAELRGHLALTTRFLFGLLNTEGLRDIGNHFGCVVPDHVKKDTLRWVQGQSHPKGPPVGAKKTAELEDIEDAEEEEEEEEDLNFGLELLYCLYETQEEDFVRQALSSLPEIVLERVRLTRMDLEVLNYCVQCCPDGQALRLVSCGLVAAKEKKKKKKSLVKRLKGSQSTKKQPPVSLLRPLCETMTTPKCHLSVLILSHCRLPDAVCRDLSEALKVAPALRELGLLQSRLTNTGLRLLCEGLAWPKCQVKTLRMQLPDLQEVINYLVIVLQQSPVLTTLDLSGCQLPGVIVEPLCAALKHPKCSLKTLSLTSVELSENSLRDLQAVKTSKPDLSIIYSK
ncbi:NACHT, LRR and PYD domains-containing protein 6 [Mus musculus]|uniref:NACHT, LRR and PYD domains-containing protein 6 n=1 Tax=Mus musculus TaxID=10090 RepID=NLRP6_MOUSE|nr:NACHT, LRR and PYD domains-containing protein 6 [Mus musculus]Q91WS2.3 RecName: Full=NACHT, LRR and PYD domains-containing protein 6; AltName: Full=Angiotensin II/vasopressin receptor; AltName: Full=Non-angiotensin-vasopressin receptor; Short=Non-AVR; AltName: Full=PYRIN-containing APAF1-like protein 5-like [Mus musculus]|eukprot:NP_598707.2 NACHT, LRR and PYD domains-containing protein 6 [Mus musculus]